MKTGNMIKIAVLPMVILIVLGIVLTVERVGLSTTVTADTTDFLPQSVIDGATDNAQRVKECLVILDSSKAYVDNFAQQMEFVLSGMSVGYDTLDISGSAHITMELLRQYRTAVVIVPDYAAISADFYNLFDWVEQGGKMFNLFPMESTPVTLSVAKKLGVKEIGNNYTAISGIKLLSDFMIGGQGYAYSFEDSSVNVMSLSLISGVTVHATSTSGIPVLWERDLGTGRIVVNNLPFSGKDSRGYMACAYCLLEDEFAYPVINSSTFAIEDCPSPRPYGSNAYLNAYYNSDTASFLKDVFWPDMLSFMKQYDLKPTGLMIASLSDDVNPPYDTDELSLSDFTEYGSSILRLGGEIAYSGYSSQPLAYAGSENFARSGLKLWNSVADSKLAFDALVSLGNKAFPDNTFSVYAPPSNLLSEAGRQMLLDNYPQIKVISGVFESYALEYEQEFGISADGVINLPRITSGATVEGNERWAALNELNFQYVSTHSFNLNEVLSPSDGTGISWEEAFSNLNDYMSWLDNIAPYIRRQTSTEAGKAVERCVTVTVRRTVTDSGLLIDIDNFYDSAYLIVRISDGRPNGVTGGSMEELGDGVYLLSADAAQVNISIER